MEPDTVWAGQQEELAYKRAVLLARSQSLRERLAQQAQVLERPLALADQARHHLQWLRARPKWLLALGLVPLLPVLLRPRRLLAWGLRLWGGWRLWQQVRAFLPAQPVPLQPPWKPPAR